MNFRIFKKLTLPLLMLLSTVEAFAQSGDITGKVVSSSDSEPLIGVVVTVEGSKTVTVTDLEGNYTISASPIDKLTFSHLGMLSQTVEVNGRSVINVKMEADRELLEDAIVVAYGTTKKESFTGSAEVVKGEKLKDRASTDIVKMLDGQVAGVMVTSGSGQPGSSASIRVRGFGSFNASNAPLLVVDGVPYDGDLSSINSNDIVSMSVLKDASAGALYGARGANGVIMITTHDRSSKEEKISVSLGMKFGISSRAIPSYDTMSAKEYMEHIYAATYSDLVYTEGYLPSVAKGLTVSTLANRFLGTDNIYNIYDVDIEDLFDSNGHIVSGAKKKYDENWLDMAQANAPLRQEYQLSVNGSTARSRYYLSFGYLDEDGILKTTGFKRYTGRVGVDVSPKKWFDIGADISYSNTNSRFLGSDGTSNNTNVWYSAMMMAPIYPVYEKNQDGSNVLDEDGNKVFDYGSSRPAGAQNNRNSVATLYDDEYYTKTDAVSGRANAAIKFLDFKLTTNFGIDNSNTYENTNYNRNNGNAAGTGRLTKETGKLTSYTWNQLLTYNGTFGNHNLDFMAGHEFYHYQYRYVVAERTGFAFDDYDELGMGSTISEASSESDSYAIDSWLSRLNYNYSDKYYFSASYRTDASSRFKKGNRWGNFWSVGGSWRISQEDFLKNVDWVTNLTLKASYGVQGNDNIGSYYAWQSLYSMSYPNANNSGAVIESVESDDITWEKNGNFNVGVEFRLFDRLYGTVEYYNRKTKDLLLYVPMAISLGFTGYYDNVGSIRNSGVDITIGADIISKKDLRWNVTLIASTLKNKVLKLSDDGEDIVSGVFLIREGLPINSFYMAKSAGIDPATGEQLYWAYETDDDGNMIKGSEYVTSNSTVATSCKYVQGSRIPDIYGSISSSLTFKNFDASVLFTWSLGGKVYDSVYHNLMEPAYIGQTYHVNASRSWKEVGDITDVPRANTDLTTLASDRFLINASYFAIKSITIGYSLGKNLLSKIDIESLRFYISCDSPWIFTHLKGMDPQASFTGSTSYSYTPNRCVNFGIDLKF